MGACRTSARLATALGAAFLLVAAAAPEPKPAVTVQSGSSEVEVTIDDALKAYPGLYDSLLAEGRRDAAKWRKDAEETRRKDPDLFAGGKRWTFDRLYKRRSVTGRYVAVLRSDGSYTGGAHPNAFTDTILWDTAAKKRISIRPFFKESADNGPTMTALAKLVRSAACAEKEKRGSSCDNPDDLTSIAPSLLKLGPLTPAPSTQPDKSSGLTFHFSAYAIGSYAEGPLTAFVPWTDFKDFLSPVGVALFGGERPETDAASLD